MWIFFLTNLKHFEISQFWTIVVNNLFQFNPFQFRGYDYGFIITVACHSLSLALQNLILVLSQLRLSQFISFFIS